MCDAHPSVLVPQFTVPAGSLLQALSLTLGRGAGLLHRTLIPGLLCFGFLRLGFCQGLLALLFLLLPQLDVLNGETHY